MSDDCYWHHGTSAEKRYPCFDGKHTVCPLCCVEKCPVETPKWFGACTAAGHPTWSRPTIPVPRKLVCLESAWDDRVFQHLSVQGFFNALAPLIHPPLKIAYRFIESTQHLTFYTRKPDGLLWSDLEAWDAPVFYLAFHGAPGKVFATLEQIGSEVLYEAFEGFGEHKNLVYFGACSVLGKNSGMKFGKKFLEVSKTRAVIGYSRDIGWMDSLAVDLLFLYRFYTHPDPWDHLLEIFNSVKQDFGPAERMGYTLIQS